MKVELLHNTPLWVADKAIGKCWNKPTPNVVTYIKDEFGVPPSDYKSVKPGCNTERIERVANKNKHASTIEHLNYTFDIDGISRACLQELARHRMASLSVKSTRYTLKELKEEEPFTPTPMGQDLRVLSGKICFKDTDIYKRASKYLVMTNEYLVDYSSIQALNNLRDTIIKNVANDKAKYCMPEAYKTSLVWTINARSLQNFLALRTSKAALAEIRELAYEVYESLPEDHKFLFTECVTNSDNK